MPAFIFSLGTATGHNAFAALDSFTRGYIEALFFTSASDPDDGELANATVSDLSVRGLQQIIADCLTFQARNAGDLGACAGDLNSAGNDFWYTRNGTGIDFSDRVPSRYTKEQAARLDKSARGFINVCESVGVVEYFNSIAMPPAEAWEYAAQWGSFVTSGDPGACMYGFDERFCVQSEKHRADCLAYIADCARLVVANPDDYEDDDAARLDMLATAVREAANDGDDCPAPVAFPVPLYLFQPPARL